MKRGETVKHTKLMYEIQAFNNLLKVSRLASKGATAKDTKDKTTIKKNGVNMILDARKGKKASIMFYLKTRI